MKRQVFRGAFVSTSKPYQIAKILGVSNGTAELALFHSIQRPEESVMAPSAQLRNASVSEHTRVYYRDESRNRWYLGRVLGGPQLSDGRWRYQVYVPAVKETKWLPERSLYVRCIGADSDPVEVLVGVSGLESQFFHERRLGALRGFIHLRAASHGLSGLLSAAIDLLPHQLDVVRRVLQDPIQRYLLADEVGLGKTIEAGIIIRQFLLDSPTGNALVLAPRELVRQWECELHEKFGIDDFPHRVQVQPFERLENVGADWAMLVVDEAHHLVAPEGRIGSEYQRLAGIAHGTERLLLLSATPVLGNEMAMLALLHLLDPVAYRLSDFEAFVDRVQRRQEYGSLLSVLRPDVAEFRPRRHAAQLRELLPHDALVAELLPSFEGATDEAERAAATRVLRRHIAETYRLHQRLIRTRRRELVEWNARQGHVTIRVDDDARASALSKTLEDWRDRATLAASSSPILQSELAGRYLALFEGLSEGVQTFRRVLNTQVLAVSQGQLATFPEDAELISAMRTTLAKQSEIQRSQVGARARSARALLSRKEKVVAFASSTDAAYELQRDIERTPGLPSGPIFLLVRDLDSRQVDQTLEDVRGHNGPAILICDAAGEEGLNLHFADALLHMDLPLSPARLEQRVGRLDRYGRRQPEIHHVVVMPSDAADSPWAAWLELLQNGFGLFTQSLSEVQFLLPELKPHIESELFLRGADGLRSLIPTISERLQEERIRLDQQYALDKLEADEGETVPLFDLLERADADESAFAEPLDQWWTHGLQLERHADSARADVFWLRWKPSTQVPNVPWRDSFRSGLDTPLTCRRQVAVRHLPVKLVRPGMPMVERQQEYLAWDDRGTAFATWRRLLAWKLGYVRTWRGFRLSFTVEADMAAVEEHLKSHGEQTGADHLSPGEVEGALPSLRRRADALLPPSVSVVHIGADDLRIVEEQELLAILALPYREARLGGQYRDYNLGRNSEALTAVIDLDEFRDLCRDVRAQAEATLLGEPGFAARVAAAGTEAERLVQEQNARLRRRHAALLTETGADDASLRREIAVNDALFACARRPRVRLDSIGFLVLSNDEPPTVVVEAQ